MAAFDYRQAEEIRDIFRAHQVRYLFLGKSGAILLGFPDTTQDADLFVQRSAENGTALVRGFPVCHIDDIIASKVASNRQKDRESLPRLRSFREYWIKSRK